MRPFTSVDAHGVVAEVLRFLARTVAEKFGFDIASLQELLHWVEIIDGALFESAAQAVELRYFGGLQLDEIAEGNKLEVCHRTA